MAQKVYFRPLLVSILALRYGVSQKEIGSAAGIHPKRVSQYLKRGDLRDDVFERLLAGVSCPPGAIPIVAGCLEALSGLEVGEADLTAQERLEVEDAVLAISRLARKTLVRAALLSRQATREEGYPRAEELAPARRKAAELFERLERLPESTRPAVIRIGREYQSWALLERVCLASEQEASRKLERAVAWARLAEKIGERIQGSEGWRNRVRGYAAAHVANVLRVSGELKAADLAFAEARRLWQAGSDPEKVLDPGRLLDLEASLRKDQRRLDEALALLDEAATLGRRPERALILKGIALEKMGRYEAAVAALRQAVSRVNRQPEPRLKNILNFNLAVNFCHIGRFQEAAELIPEARGLAAEMGDEIALLRMTWLEGRIAAGLEDREKARRLLGEARRGFSVRGMSYDVALAVLEEATLLLREGRTAEVKVLAQGLTLVFGAKGVHREALAALRLFHHAAAREEATVELARAVLSYLFRARHDQGLRFSES